MMQRQRMRYVGLALVVGLTTGLAFGDYVMEGPREIPVAYDVDVVVVGGSSAGVAAAVAAAQSGAKVFVAAPRPYLGEDLCASWRLWLEPGEEPGEGLAKDLFAEPDIAAIAVGKGLPFTYDTDVPSADGHKDSNPPSVLTDGNWGRAHTQSVEYDGDVAITADLGAEKALGNVHVLLYQRPRDIEAESVAITVSNDKQQWRDATTLKNDRVGREEFIDTPLRLSGALDGSARYVRFLVHKSDKAKRVLLGEIVIEPKAGLAQPLPKAQRVPPTPMQVKRVLDDALIHAGVQFLYGCYVTDVLRDAQGHLAGIVMANRSGRQAVRAKVIIDTTPRAAVARLAGVAFDPYPTGPETFTRVVLGTPAAGNLAGRPMPTPLRSGGKGGASVSEFNAVEYALDLPMHDASFASFAEAEQRARDLTWNPAQVGSSELLFQVPPDAMKAKKVVEGPWQGADNVDLNAFETETETGLYVLGGCAGVSREAAKTLVRPLNLIATGTRIGGAAAGQAKSLAKPEGVSVGIREGIEAGRADVRETLDGVRSFPTGGETVKCGAHPLPVFGAYDVVVVGGGTAGAPAGIGAARQDAKTLVVEYLDGLGGVGTLGLIGTYYYGYRHGFTEEVDKGVAAMDGGVGKVAPSWNVEWKMEWYRRELRKAGAEIWFGALACGVSMDGTRVTGVVVATPEGRGLVKAKVVIDATGNASVAAWAGADSMATRAVDIAVQGTGLPPREPGAHYTNTDYTITDDSDVVDAWRTFVAGRNKYKDAFDLAGIVDSRERQRVVGDYILSPLDIWNGRTFPDSVVYSQSNFDTHGYTVHPFFSLKAPHKDTVSAYTPYRCLLPRGLDGIIVTGLGISAHRDAMPILRMQPDIQNQGYAMGVAASMAASAGIAPRDIDVKALQKHLVEKGNLPANVLTDTDSYPLSQEKIAAAVKSLPNEYEGIGIVLDFPDKSIPLMQAAYDAAAAEPERLVYAHVLGMLGVNKVAPALAQAIAASAWDKGWSLSGMGQFGASLSPLDSLIIALGNTGNAESIDTLIAKANLLDSSSEFSHFRALALAFENLRDPKAAPALAALLKKPGIGGYACTDIESAKRAAENPNPNIDRDYSLRELILARALYRCGDCGGLGQATLKRYEQDLRGHLARHAHCILQSPNQAKR